MKRLSYGLLALWLFSSLNVYAQSYYLSSSTGNDTLDGKTEATAWKTITRYHQAMRSKTFKISDDIYFKRGDTFQGQIYTTLIPGGTAQDPFTIGAYGDPNLPNPVISALLPINKWQSVKVNGIQACVSDISAIMNNLSVKSQYNTYPIDDMMAGKVQTAPTNLLFDGNLQRLARYPNDSYLFVDEKSSGDTLLDTELSGVPNAQGWVGGQIALRTTNWDYRFTDVKSISGTTMKLADSIVGNLAIRNGYFFLNKLIGLDTPGEWFTDTTAKKMYFVPPPSVNCADLENRVTASVFELGISLVDYMTVQDLTFIGFGDAAVYLSSLKQQMKVLRNKIFSSRVGVRGTGVSFIDVSNNEMRNIFGEAIVFWPGTNVNITNNLIENVGIYPAMQGSYNAIRFGSDKPETSIKNVIANNVIRNVGYSGIMFRVGSGKAGEESIIEKNVIERAMASLADGGAIYLQDCVGNIIRNNIILNTYGNKDSWREGKGFFDYTAFAFGIVLFMENNNNNQLLNNTIINTDDGIHVGSPIKNTVIKNNVLYNNRAYQLSIAMGTYTGTASLNYDVQNNIFYAIDPVQWAMGQFKRDQKNWLFGVFENNFYGQPYYNSSFVQNIGVNSGVELYRSQLNTPGNLLYNFDTWQSVSGQDKNSKTDAEKWVVLKINDKLYDVAQVLSPNLITNSTFDTTAPWEVTAGAITQEKKTGMDGTVLHLKNDYSDVLSRVNNGYPIAFEKDQYYQLSFSTMRDTDGSIRLGIFDRTSAKGYTALGGRYIFPTGPKRRDYTYLFKLDNLGTDMRVYFMMEKTDSDVWIDNVQLYKVSLKEAMAAQERSKIFVNRGAAKKTFPLNGNVYKDLTGATVKDNVAVDPYSSKILTYVSTTPGQRPGIPNFFMNLEGRKLTAKWSAANASGYKLYYAPYPACSPVFMEEMGPLTGITLDNLLTGTAYYATVTAYNQYGESAFPVDGCLGEASYFIVP